MFGVIDLVDFGCVPSHVDYPREDHFPERRFIDRGSA
jgi:hypothetical protein